MSCFSFTRFFNFLYRNDLTEKSYYLIYPDEKLITHAWDENKIYMCYLFGRPIQKAVQPPLGINLGIDDSVPKRPGPKHRCPFAWINIHPRSKSRIPRVVGTWHP